MPMTPPPREDIERACALLEAASEPISIRGAARQLGGGGLPPLAQRHQDRPLRESELLIVEQGLDNLRLDGSSLSCNPPNRCISAGPQWRSPGCPRFGPVRPRHRMGIASRNSDRPSESCLHG